MRALICLLLLALSTTVAAEIYRIVGPDGEVTYSDQPAPGAETIKTKPTSTYTPQPSPAASPASTSQPPVTKLAPYESLTITQPANEETVRENAGRLEVIVQVEPPIMDATRHMLQITLDGAALPDSYQPGEPIVLENLDRGEHTLGAILVTSEGEPLISAEPVTFYIQRVSIQSPEYKKQHPPPAAPKPK